MEEKRIKASFLAINPFEESNVIQPVEHTSQGSRYVTWGEGNLYPNFLFDLYQKCSTLQTVINGTVDFVCGDKINNLTKWQKYCNRNCETIDEIIRQLAIDILIYGGGALNIINNRLGEPVEIYNIDFKNLRSDKKNHMFYFSEKFGKPLSEVTGRFYSNATVTAIPAFDKDANNPSSVIYFKLNGKYSTYPNPIWSAAATAAATEKKISEYHLNAISNGFASNCIINLNNGVPTDEVKEEIEELLNDKYSGSENAGRPFILYNIDKDHSAEVQRLDLEDFGDRYDSLAKWTRQQIFTAFRANPNLFGINTESNGFAQEDFESPFKLFNKTVVSPIQKAISGIFTKLTGDEDAISFEPFKISFEKGEVDTRTVGSEGTENNSKNATI